MTGKELHYVAQAGFGNRLAGDGFFTQQAHLWLEKNLTSKRALLTHSCTAALELAAILLDIKPGDEVIIPSYTFVSTANAFVLRGATPVYVDIRSDTLNIDEAKIEAAITNRTKAIVPVHYAGVSCEMDTILNIARSYHLLVVEDAAQGILSGYRDKPLGSIGALGSLSFHETKNIISGEGGAILINDHEYAERAEIVREKGTNRSKYFRDEVDKYTWCDIGSSFLPGEIIAAFLCAQLQDAEKITEQRIDIWNRYHEMLSEMEQLAIIRRPVIPSMCSHNAHIYYVILPNGINRKNILEGLKLRGVNAVFHYVPLHTSPAGKKYGRVAGTMTNTEELSERIIRLPLWLGLTYADQQRVVDSLRDLIIGELSKSNKT